jgi:hypothetical protein
LGAALGDPNIPPRPRPLKNIFHPSTPLSSIMTDILTTVKHRFLFETMLQHSLKYWKPYYNINTMKHRKFTEELVYIMRIQNMINSDLLTKKNTRQYHRHTEQITHKILHKSIHVTPIINTLVICIFTYIPLYFSFPPSPLELCNIDVSAAQRIPLPAASSKI